jgi:hypothetical protein
MVNIQEIGSQVFNRISNIPTTISVGSVVDYITYGKIDVENYLGETIDTVTIPTKYQNILISIGCMYTLTNMLGTNADFDTALGEFRLNKVDRTSPEFRELSVYQNHIKESLTLLRYGSTHQFKLVWGAV